MVKAKTHCYIHLKNHLRWSFVRKHASFIVLYLQDFLHPGKLQCSKEPRATEIKASFMPYYFMESQVCSTSSEKRGGHDIHQTRCTRWGHASCVGLSEWVDSDVMLFHCNPTATCAFDFKIGPLSCSLCANSSRNERSITKGIRLMGSITLNRGIYLCCRPTARIWTKSFIVKPQKCSFKRFQESWCTF